MKKNIVHIVGTLAIAFGAFAAFGIASAAETDNTLQGHVTYNDFKTDNPLTEYIGQVGELSGKLGDAIAAAKDETQLDNIVAALSDLKVEDGWAKQIGALRDAGDAVDIFSKAMDCLNAGKTALELKDAYKAGNRDAFSKIAADAMTDLASNLLCKLFNKYYTMAGAKLVILSSAGGPVSVVLTAAGVALVGWLGNKGIEKGVGLMMHQEDVRKLLEDIGGAVYDLMGGKKEDDDGGGQVCRPGDDPDPFDSAPGSGGSGGQQSGGNKNDYRGLKPLRLVK